MEAQRFTTRQQALQSTEYDWFSQSG